MLLFTLFIAFFVLHVEGGLVNNGGGRNLKVLYYKDNGGKKSKVDKCRITDTLCVALTATYDNGRSISTFNYCPNSARNNHCYDNS